MSQPIRTHHEVGRSGESLLVAATASRLSLVVPLIYGIFSSAELAVFALAAIVAMDIADGVVARALEMESARRRVVDAGVDKLLIHSAAIAGAIAEPSLVIFYIPFAIRDFGLAFADVWCIRQLKTHIAGGSIHRASSASIALLAFVALTCDRPTIAFAAVIGAAINYMLVPSYVRTFREALESGPSPAFTVLATDTVPLTKQRERRGRSSFS